MTLRTSYWARPPSSAPAWLLVACRLRQGGRGARPAAVLTSRSRASPGSRRSAASRTICSSTRPSRAASTSATTPRSTSSPAARARRPASSMVRTIEFEADTNKTFNTDETWIFLRGGWGEIRLGDEDGVVDNSVVGGQTIAAGTGGIDGSDAVICRGAGGVPDQHQRRDQDPLLHAELRRLQPRRVATRRPRRTSTAAPTTAISSPRKDGALAMAGREHRRGCRRSTTAISAGWACWPRWSASMAS